MVRDMLHEKRNKAHAAPDALEMVFRQYARLIYRFIYSKVGNREDAEDLTSIVFLKAAQWLDGERPAAQIQAWLYATARSVLVEHWQQTQDQMLDITEVEALLFQEEPDITEEQTNERRLATILNSLPERARAVLTLRFLHGYTLAETAAALGITESNVKVIQHRALKQAAKLGEPDRE